MPAFLDPNKPLATCASENCEGCKVSEKLHCHFCARDLTHFLLTVMPPVLPAIAGIVHVDWRWLVPWLLAALGYFGFLEIRVMCSHCPHYAEQSTSSLKCWANYGSPKLWKYRPGPMSRMETFWFFSGAVLLIYPLVFLLIGAQWFLLAMYVLTTVGAAVTLQTSFCPQCINFACPLNWVDDATRQAFFERNPTVAQAWKS